MRLVLSTVKYLIRKGKPYLVPGVFCRVSLNTWAIFAADIMKTCQENFALEHHE